MTAPQEWLDDLRERARNGKVVLVCGTGMSAALTNAKENATWTSLLRSGVNHLLLINGTLADEAQNMLALVNVAKPSTPALVAVAQWLRMQFRGFPTGEYNRWLETTVGALQLNPDAMRFLADTKIPILTTNYDNLLEDRTGRTTLTWLDHEKIARLYDVPEKYIFHLHGHWDNASSVILSGEDYQRLASAPDVARVFQQIVPTFTPIFIGYGNGMSDPNFDSFLTWFTENLDATARRMYVLCRSGEAPDVLVNRNNLYHISYGDSYDELPDFLAGLLPANQTNPGQFNKSQTEDVQGPELTDATNKRPTMSTASERASGDRLQVLPAAVRIELERQLGPGDTWEPFQTQVMQSQIDVIASRGAALVTAVTGTGKTTVSRAAMNVAVAGGHSAVMLVPTKALVAQELREWNQWVAAWLVEDRQIRVYAASRDYPESDSPVSRGRFEVAIAIYEKLAGYLAAGQPTLSKAAILVVDELQTLVADRDRATKLESLLTMVRLLPSDSRPAIVGLSATLSLESTDTLRAWLNISPERFIRSNSRSVPLDTFVLDANRVRTQTDSHLFGLSDAGTTPPQWTEVEHDLLSDSSSGKGTLSVKGMTAAPLAVALVAKLLVNDPLRRIIVFVPGRTAAEDMALAIQRRLDALLGAPSRKLSPWTSGRFASSDHDSELAEERFEELRNSDLPMVDNVVRGLRQGVAYHSARLPAQLRRRLEDEFRDPIGVLRVLVATDTLAQGVNLPADTVINCSLGTYGSDRQLSLATPAELDNKAGRAGRRGLAARPRGEFYILVPSERDLQDVQNLTATSVKALASIGGVFEQFVTGTDRSPRVVGRIRSLDDVALLSLHVLCSDGFGRRPEALEGRVSNIIANLLAAQTGDADLPSAVSVIERLKGLSLISPVGGEKLRLSRLGEALARSALSLRGAHVLEQLARIAVQGSGDLDLLFNACLSTEIEGVTAWIGLPGVPRRHYPSLKENILTYALAYCATTLQQRRDCAQYFSKSRHQLPNELVEEGQKVVSRELSEILAKDVELIEDRDATALLRAIVSFEWSRGVPFEEMKARFSSSIVSDEDQRGRAPVEIKIHYSDVEQLSEQIAGVIRGATAISFSERHDWSARIAALALRVEVGLPTWLAPIARLRNPLLHRNRLARLWRVDPVQGRISDVLDLAELRESRGISSAQRDVLREVLDRREREDAAYRHMVAQEWASELVPGLFGPTFEDFGIELEQASNATSYCDLLSELAQGLGIDTSVKPSTTGFISQTWQIDNLRIDLAVPEGELGGDEVTSIADTDCIVLIRQRLRTSAYVTLSQRPTVARFVRPEVVLEVLAKLQQARGEGLEGGEVLERLAALKVSVLDSEALVLSLDVPAGPPPFTGPGPRQMEASNLGMPVMEENAD